VLAGAGERLLERVSTLDAAPRRVLDVGTGTGLLAFAAAGRWPDSTVVGLDASAAMLSLARQRTAERWPGRHHRIAWQAADAAALPLEDGSVDLVVSSFMLQLVPERLPVLREAWRVLRPGGHLGIVTWLDEDAELDADIAFDEAVMDLDLIDPEVEAGEPGEGEYADPAAARDELLAVGFERVDARLDELHHTWTHEAYLEFKVGFDESDLFDSLSEADRARLRTEVAERWASLPDEAFVLRAPLVSVTARRPG
jgi:ubiquinone/menaquinone biosynthesis C-methylase UbiE